MGIIGLGFKSLRVGHWEIQGGSSGVSRLDYQDSQGGPLRIIELGFKSLKVGQQEPPVGLSGFTG